MICDAIDCSVCRPPRGCVTCGARAGEACFQYRPGQNGFLAKDPRVHIAVDGGARMRGECLHLRADEPRHQRGRTPEYMPAGGARTLTAWEMLVNLNQLVDAATEAGGELSLVAHGFGLALCGLDRRQASRGELYELASRLNDTIVVFGGAP